jgi:hypothetical protein
MTSHTLSMKEGFNFYEISYLAPWHPMGEQKIAWRHVYRRSKTENAALRLARRLESRGMRRVKVLLVIARDITYKGTER